MAGNETEHKKGFAADPAIEGILREYPMINAKDILLFAPVYYPIADIEIDFEEKSFEDFESVQITVLKLLNIGHKSCETIAALMGLTPFYVEKVINVLCGFGHIDTKLNVTPLGAESIENGKKITTIRGVQRFQLDALALNLIRLDKTVTRKSVVDKDKLSNGVMILDFADAVSKDNIIKELKSDEFSRLMASKNKVLNVNIKNINRISCLGIRYVQAYFLKLKGHEVVFFSERENFSKTGRKKYSWLPFAGISGSTARYLGVDDLPIYPEYISQKILATVAMLEKETTTEKTDESIQNAMEAIISKEDYGFVSDYIDCDYDNAYIVIKSKRAFSQVNLKTVALLKSLADNGVYLSTNKNLRGVLIKLFTADTEILKALNKLNQVLEKQGSEDVFNNIRLFVKKVEKGMNSAEDYNIIDIINNYKV